MTTHPPPSDATTELILTVLPGFVVCDNLTGGYSRGLDLGSDSVQQWLNLSDVDLPARRETTSSYGNVTCLEHAPRLTSAMYFKAVVLAILSILSFAANVATIYSVTRNRRRQHSWSAIYTLILHLALADLLVTVFCIAGEAAWSYTVAWIWGNVACKMFKFLQVFSLYLSTFVLVLIGVDRFVAVRYPMKGLNTAHRCTRFLVAAWVSSFVLALPQV
ncbi:hypothetical protein KM043_005246 [Ampulex compressa]|nr:hypothetical protein KM043_005246 [Ampulex compressa]